MNLLDPWNIFFFGSFIVYVGIRRLFFKRTKEIKSIVSHFDRLERGLLAGMVPGFFILPLMYLFSPWLSFADYPLPASLKLTGSILIILSLWLFWRSHLDLGENWSVSIEIREKHRLITDGVYRFVRHPMYSSIWMWGIGQGLVLENWMAGWMFTAGFTALYFVRLHREEQMMIDQFGDEYRNYIKQTGRIFPKWKSL